LLRRDALRDGGFLKQSGFIQHRLVLNIRQHLRATCKQERCRLVE
jgi:hypothetical protein